MLCLLALVISAGSLDQGFSNRSFPGGGTMTEREVRVGEYPSQFLGAHNCGASVLNHRFALTAAHCVHLAAPQFLSIRSGVIDLHDVGMRHRVLRYLVHENYDPKRSWLHDIALVEVSPSFAISWRVQPVPLPTRDQLVLIGECATVIGWGKTSPRGSTISTTLREAQIEIRSHAVCRSAYRHIGYEVFPSQICADTPLGYRGSCYGDSGGPLLVDGTVIGLVSWALGCATPGYPTVYTRVSFYRGWIRHNTGV